MLQELMHVLSFSDSENGDLCLSPQYMPLGQKGSINCDFGDQFYGVYWYNTSDYENTEPILYFTNRQKSGLGYDTEEFNIFQNGSLIINNVSLQHEGDFTVIMFREESGVTIPNFVKVIVTGKHFVFGFQITESNIKIHFNGLFKSIYMTIINV